MATVTNNNLRMIDRPMWEQLSPAQANSAAGSCVSDDGVRFAYYLISAASFWRYDTWADTWQQLANPTGGTVGVGSMIRYTQAVGGQFNNVVYGSIYALISNGVAAPIMNKYDIATNTWSALSVTNLPATFGTDACFVYPTSYENANTGGFQDAFQITLSANANISDTAITVNAITKALAIGTVLNFGSVSAPKYAVLTATAAASATSLTVSPLVSAITSGTSAWYADNMYLIGNNATVVYRYSVGTNAWATTSIIGGTPVLGAVPGAVGAGSCLKWLPAINANYLYAFRGGATNNVYRYDMSTNAWTSVTYNPATETFTTGSHYAVKMDGSLKGVSILAQKDATLRIFDLDPVTGRLNPKCTQNIFATGAALVGDRMWIMRSPEGVDFLYFILHTSATMLRTPLFF